MPVTHKTNVHLADDLKAAVERTAKQRGVAETEVFRCAIAAAVSRPAARSGLFASDDVLPGSEAPELTRRAQVIAHDRDQSVGSADASLVVAGRFSTVEIVTLDHRHFNILRSLSGVRSTLLP